MRAKERQLELLEVCKRSLEQPHQLVAKALLDLASTCDELGQRGEAESFSLRGIELCESMSGVGEEHVMLLGNLGDMYRRWDRKEEGVEAASAALDIAKGDLGS